MKTPAPAPLPTPPQPPPSSRWTPQAVIGLLCFVAAVILRRVLQDPDVADGLMLLGGSLVGWAPPLPPIKPPGGGGHGGAGGSLTGVIVGIVLGGAAMLLPGCAWQTRKDGDTFALRLRDSPERPPPACWYRWSLDGELVLEGAVAECPKVPACQESPPETGSGEVTP